MKTKIILFIRCLFLTSLFISWIGCDSPNKQHQKRFFSDDSFWNKLIPVNPEIDSRSDEWIELLKLEPSIDHFDFNNTEWTIPVYEVNSETPVYDIKHRALDEKEKIFRLSNRDSYGFGKGFGENVPIPDQVNPDPEDDAHFAVVD